MKRSIGALRVPAIIGFSLGLGLMYISGVLSIVNGVESADTGKIIWGAARLVLAMIAGGVSVWFPIIPTAVSQRDDQHD